MRHYTKTFKTIALLLLTLMAIAIQTANAQDPQFSQFYAAPTTLNPALAGAGIGARFIANARNQWSALPYSYVTYGASFDINLKEIRSGVGVRVVSDQAGSGALSSNTFGVQYSYVIPLTRKVRIRTGLDGAYTSHTINFNRLQFPDQLSLNGIEDIPTDEPTIGYNDQVSYFDFSTGAVIYSKYFWAGLALHHMNTPAQSFTDELSTLPTKLTLHGGMQIPFGKYSSRSDKRTRSISPTMNYKHQGDYDQFDLGVYVNYEPIIVGMWYRGLPIITTVPGNFNQDALVFLFGLKQKNYRVGYSYDLTISNLGVASSAGSHEISLTLEFETSYIPKRRRVKRREMYVPCPKF